MYMMYKTSPCIIYRQNKSIIQHHTAADDSNNSPTYDKTGPTRKLSTKLKPWWRFKLWTGLSRVKRPTRHSLGHWRFKLPRKFYGISDPQNGAVMG